MKPVAVAYSSNIRNKGHILMKCKLGTWYFGNKTGKEHMFTLFVAEQLDSWPEKEIRERTWMNVREARKLYQNGWIKEALELLVSHLTSQKQADQRGTISSNRTYLQW